MIIAGSYSCFPLIKAILFFNSHYPHLLYCNILKWTEKHVIKNFCYNLLHFYVIWQQMFALHNANQKSYVFHVKIYYIFVLYYYVTYFLMQKPSLPVFIRQGGNLSFNYLRLVLSNFSFNASTCLSESPEHSAISAVESLPLESKAVAVCLAFNKEPFSMPCSYFS